MLGEPWRIALRRFSGLFLGLNFLQIAVLDVYLGGFLLYIVAIIPFHLFSKPTLYAITVISFFVVFLVHRTKFRRVVQNLRLGPKKSLFRNSHSLEFALVISMFAFTLFMQTLPFNNLLLGSVRDTSIHSLFVQVLIENKEVPVTLQPYLDEGIVYPQGFTPLAAYSALVMNYVPPQAVFYLTALFNSLAVLGAYYLGKVVSEKGHLGLSLAFVFTFVAFWPKYITWGSNALVASFPFYFVCLSFLPLLVRERLKIEAVIVIGVLFGYLSVLHLQTFEPLLVSLFILWLYVALKREKNRWYRLQSIVIISCMSLLILAPFVYRALAFYQYPMHNIGVPEDIEATNPEPGLSTIVTGIAWLADHIAANELLKVASFVLFIVSTLSIVSFRRNENFRLIGELVVIGLATLLGQLLLFLLRAVVPSDFLFYPHPMLLYFPFYFFIATLPLIAYASSFSRFSQRMLLGDNGTKLKTRVLVTAISLILLLAIYSPFLYQSLVRDSGELYGSYTVFSVTTAQDSQLILWITDNLPKNATILVNTFQSGTFIPSIANRKAVFPSFASSTSVTYQKLVALLEQNVFNATTLDLMKRFNITDVYVGSGVSPWDNWIHRWNPNLFLGNPQFTLMKNFGNAYLFHCNYVNTSVVFLDDFEHSDWDENGWLTQYAGNGLGKVTIVSDFGYNSQRSLRITAQAMYTVTEWRCARSVSREIFLPNDSDVIFSFYVNAVEGFSRRDTFAIVISNVYHNQSMIVTTPQGIYEGYRNTRTLSGFVGLFSYDLSVSWREFFNSPLPNTLMFELVNWDFDGVENVAYVDNVALAATPIS